MTEIKTDYFGKEVVSMQPLEKMQARWKVVSGLPLDKGQVRGLGGERGINDIRTGWQKIVETVDTPFKLSLDPQELVSLGGNKGVNQLRRLYSFSREAQAVSQERALQSAFNIIGYDKNGECDRTLFKITTLGLNVDDLDSQEIESLGNGGVDRIKAVKADWERYRDTKDKRPDEALVYNYGSQSTVDKLEKASEVYKKEMDKEVDKALLEKYKITDEDIAIMNVGQKVSETKNKQSGETRDKQELFVRFDELAKKKELSDAERQELRNLRGYFNTDGENWREFAAWKKGSKQIEQAIADQSEKLEQNETEGDVVVLEEEPDVGGEEDSKDTVELAPEPELADKNVELASVGDDSGVIRTGDQYNEIYDPEDVEPVMPVATTPTVKAEKKSEPAVGKAQIWGRKLAASVFHLFGRGKNLEVNDAGEIVRKSDKKVVDTLDSNSPKNLTGENTGKKPRHRWLIGYLLDNSGTIGD